MTFPSSRRFRWPLLLALLVAHGLVFIGMRLAQPPASAPVHGLTVRLVQEQPKPEKEKPPAWYRPPVGDWFGNPERLLPTPAVPSSETSPVAAMAAAPASAASAPQKLNLALPLRMQAATPTAKELTSHDLHDGQPNRKSVEYRVADAAGTLPIETSTTTDGLGSTMVRQGSKCTKIVANRLSTVDPFDSRAKLPPTSGDCFKK